MNKNQIENALNKVDWIEFHKSYCFPTYGYRTQICVWANGSFTEMASNNTFQETPETLVGIIHAEGIANMNSEDYSDGWATWNENDNSYTTDEGKKISFEEMMEIAIQDGDWDDLIDEWKQELLEQN